MSEANGGRKTTSTFVLQLSMNRISQVLTLLFLGCLSTVYTVPEVSGETGALLVYSCFITYKSFYHRPISIEHAELLGM